MCVCACVYMCVCMCVYVCVFCVCVYINKITSDRDLKVGPIEIVNLIMIIVQLLAVHVN